MCNFAFTTELVKEIEKEIDDQNSREESMLKRLEFLDKYMYLM